MAQPSDSKLRGKWWEIFNDPELNALEEQLDINNQNIKQFFENFMEARAVVREARSQYFPTLAVAPCIHPFANLGKSEHDSRQYDWQGHRYTATAIHYLFAAPRSIMGARPLGQGPQHRTPIPIRRPGQRGGSRERAPD